jgi:hypothetical protein
MDSTPSLTVRLSVIAWRLNGREPPAKIEAVTATAASIAELRQ